MNVMSIKFVRGYIDLGGTERSADGTVKSVPARFVPDNEHGLLIVAIDGKLSAAGWNRRQALRELRKLKRESR